MYSQGRRASPRAERASGQPAVGAPASVQRRNHDHQLTVALPLPAQVDSLRGG